MDIYFTTIAVPLSHSFDQNGVFPVLTETRPRRAGLVFFIPQRHLSLYRKLFSLPPFTNSPVSSAYSCSKARCWGQFFGTRTCTCTCWSPTAPGRCGIPCFLTGKLPRFASRWYIQFCHPVQCLHLNFSAEPPGRSRSPPAYDVIAMPSNTGGRHRYEHVEVTAWLPRSLASPSKLYASGPRYPAGL